MRPRVVWKYVLELPPHPEPVVVEMPEDADILSAGAQDGRVVVWAACNPGLQKTERALFVVPTGFMWNRAEVPYFIGTVQFPNGIVVHVFEAMPE